MHDSGGQAGDGDQAKKDFHELRYASNAPAACTASVHAPRFLLEAASVGGTEAELKGLRRRADDLARMIERVRNVMTVMDKPEAMAPKLVELTEQKKVIDEQLAAIADKVAENRVVRSISEDDVRRILGDLVAHIGELGRGELKARLRVLLAKVVINPADLPARIHYSIPAATGVSVASPRGFGRDITAFASRIEVPLEAWQPAT